MMKADLQQIHGGQQIVLILNLWASLNLREIKMNSYWFSKSY